MLVLLLGQRKAWPKGTRENLSRDQGGYCIYCRQRLLRVRSHIDHILPVVRGGSNEYSNLQLLCWLCNLRKSDRTDSEFRQRYRALLPQQKGVRASRRIKTHEFQSVTRTTKDVESYLRFKAGKHLTAAQKVNFGAGVTGVVAWGLVFLPLYALLRPDDASSIFVVSVLLGGVIAAGVRARAWWTGLDRD